jgi:outer membrane autotransporter protein
MVTSPPRVDVYYVIPPALAAGETHSHESGANLLMGYDFSSGRYSVGPRAGLRFKKSSTDAFIETGETLLTLAFDEQTKTSVRSALGLQGAMTFNAATHVVVTQANVDWIHEYRDDQQLLSARFAEDYRANASRLRFLTQAPDRDFYEARLSAVVVLPHGASIFLSVSSTVGNALLHQRGATLGARFEL